MLELKGKVLETIRRRQLLEGGESILVALSGGADSVALLHLLRALAPDLGLTLSAAHFNHRLRGEASDADEAFVGQLCRSLDIPLETGRPAEPLRRSGGNLEEAARRARYDFLAAIARTTGSVVATGHHLDDQAETLLLKLFRGSGLTGLAGIHAMRHHRMAGASPESAAPVKVIRPLLEVSRQEIEVYLQERGLDAREDLLNDDLSFDRNWMRHHLLPTLARRVNPRIRETLARTAGLLTEIGQVLDQQTQLASAACVRETDAGTLVAIEPLRRVEIALQRAVLRRAIEQRKGNLLAITAAHVEAALHLCDAVSGRQVSLPGGIVVRREFDQLVVTRHRGTRAFAHTLFPPGELWLSEVGKGVRLRALSALPGADGGVVLRPSAAPVTIRNRRPGDRFRLEAGGRSRKLKEVFAQYRIPLRERDERILVEAAGELVWVEGLPFPKASPTGYDAGSVFAIEVYKRNFSASSEL